MLGRLPAFVSDEPIDEDSRKLKVKLKGQTFKGFEAVKDSLASSLNVYIDEIAETTKMQLKVLLTLPLSEVQVQLLVYS